MYKIVVGEDKSLLVFSLYSDIFLYSTMDLQTQKGLKEKKIEEKHLSLEVQSLAFEVSDVQAQRGCLQEDMIR